MPMRRRKAFIAAFAAAVFISGVMLTFSGAASGGSGVAAELSESGSGVSEKFEIMKKDETVYAILNEDGSVSSVYVVNHFSIPADGMYADYGNYRNVKSLSEDIQPRTEEDLVVWELKKSYGDFYYQGEPVDVRLPWNFEIEYFLDGEKIDARDLPGKSGTVEIDIIITPEETAPAYFQKRFAIQIQVPVNLDRAEVVSADAAVQTVTGSTETLAYTVLPGSSANYRIVLEAVNFEMDNISIGISEADYSGIISSLGISGIDELREVMEDWAIGAEKVGNGLEGFSDGLNRIASGTNNLYAGSRELYRGSRELSEGFSEFRGSVSELRKGSAGIRDGLSEISSAGESLLTGYRQMERAILASLPDEAGKEQLRILAQYADVPESPYAQAGSMAKSLLEQISDMEQLYRNLNALNNTLSRYSEGVKELSEQYAEFDEGIAALAVGTDNLARGVSGLETGIRQLSEGLAGLNAVISEMNGNMKEVPGNARKLIAGADALRNAASGGVISEMLGKDSGDVKKVSFVSPEKGEVNSVQFVLRTPAIKAAEKEKAAAPAAAGEKKNFWRKLAALFR
jgi:hypothetical protein